MSPQINVQIPPAPAHDYPIYINTHLLSHPKKWLPKDLNYHNIVIITDNTVKKHHLNTLLDRLKTLQYSPLVLSFPAGEKSKSQTTKQMIEEKMLRHKLGRDTLCIALGGGVVGDLAGFISATYMRGIPYIQIPTTLLAMVDSSVGGKTAIDTPQGKNLIGAFWQPHAVVADIDCLKTLPQKHIICGFVEALKMFATSDEKSFRFMQSHFDMRPPKQRSAGHATLSPPYEDEKSLITLIQRAVTVKANVVALDEKETNLRMILNFGHTFGHALEQVADYKILHGYAVAYGILVESNISRLLGILDDASYQQITMALHRLGFEAKALKKFNIDDIIRATQSDKKTTAGKAKYVLLETIGKVHVKNDQVAHFVDDQMVREAFEDL